MEAAVAMILQYTPPRLHLTPHHHGRRVSLEDFENAVFEEGYQYEIIDGRVYVSHLPEYPHASIEIWLLAMLLAYVAAHPKVANFVCPSARIFVRNRPGATCPEPDIALYRDFPVHLPRKKIRWRDFTPIVVIEIISPDNADKDFERNVELYLEVPTIREYWIVDQRPDPDYPTLTVYRRRGKKWQKPIIVSPGETYKTRLLPGFELKLDSPEE